jgi:hypothetical protein
LIQFVRVPVHSRPGRGRPGTHSGGPLGGKPRPVAASALTAARCACGRRTAVSVGSRRRSFGPYSSTAWARSRGRSRGGGSDRSSRRNWPFVGGGRARSGRRSRHRRSCRRVGDLASHGFCGLVVPLLGESVADVALLVGVQLFPLLARQPRREARAVRSVLLEPGEGAAGAKMAERGGEGVDASSAVGVRGRASAALDADRKQVEGFR